jgi:hypothetical protein
MLRPGSRAFLQVLCFYCSRWFVLGKGLTSDNLVRSREGCVEWAIYATRKTFYDRISPVRLFRSDWCQSSCSVLSAGHGVVVLKEPVGLKKRMCVSVRDRDGGRYIYYCGIGSIRCNLDSIFFFYIFAFLPSLYICLLFSYITSSLVSIMFNAISPTASIVM